MDAFSKSTIFGDGIKSLHLMGVGGAGMSGLAHLLKELGYEVSGCDVSRTSYICNLERLGIKVLRGHCASHIDIFKPDLLVYSSAIAWNNVELEYARKVGVNIARRGDILSALFNRLKGIGIAGAHGKTTTSSMIATVLDAAGLDPTVAIGGEVSDIGGNARLGHGEYMVSELDESDGSFELFSCHIPVITNIDWDHVNFYPTFQSVQDAFVRFLSNRKDGGKIVMCGEDAGCQSVSKLFAPHCITYGWGKHWNWGAVDVNHSIGGGVTFTAIREGKEMGRLALRVSGEHNVLNALAACAVGDLLNIDFGIVQKALYNFKGTKRRLQCLGISNGIYFYDDYGHHPREIRATLDTLRNIFPSHRLVVIFQPHRYTRTKAMYAKFAEVLANADVVYILPVYPADEKLEESISSDLITNCLVNEYGHERCLSVSEGEVVTKVADELLPGDILLTLGAGNVNVYGNQIFNVIASNLRRQGMVSI
ncbi:MAG TPA: UDP-N-acetylmuramate--L-alanine ligase [Acetomicrobium flavidum]|uniref:UDP-N-acetylmuramate--L-alanine ligase n=1 Tax=Acetomicrobium flavidum TaxID=49896 RepID=A0ABY1JAW6_9BACT|nr:UDP-N-acetylmuramate--L-alanine ligase [Acetomicrobium flavidum]HOJ81778.1 UDP-N-acetylmuramate--L-alanine ligase [Acetomicrobium flavidum]HOM30812.1 UDP-N-acetylmuramate--L-alanine ligase [Acetomicrobium flavidum]HPP14021.1 UDP-N-acetylmuramate--L-alanine ligase [Acetomicrobium flavidum]